MITNTVGERLVALVKTIVFARHGKAVKANPSDPDETRQLNQLGFEQALKLGAKLTPYRFDLVLSSPLLRARMTMAVATVGHYVVHDVPELSCLTGPESPIEKMWAELGNVPISHYFKHPLAEGLREWTNKAKEAFLDAIANHGHMRGGQTVLVGGHALLQNALACALAAALHEQGMADAAAASNMAANEILSDGEAFVFTLDRLCCQNRVISEHIKLD